MRAVLLLAALAITLAVASPAPAASADGEDWVVISMAVDITIEASGTVRFDETIAVDLGSTPSHGIFRDVETRLKCGNVEGEAPLHTCPPGSVRTYRLAVESVTSAGGRPLPWALESDGGTTRIRIGDPDRTVTGEQTYRLAYTVEPALNAFASHDELYWNAVGRWPVTIREFRARVALPGTEAIRAVCYQGPFGSREECQAAGGAGAATYRATRPLAPGEGVTIVAGWPSGVVTVAPPLVERQPSIGDYFTFDAWELGGTGLLAVAAIVVAAAGWYRLGRDRRYTTVYYLTNDPTEETKPLFGGPQVVVEFLPPEGLRPAQMGVLLDERADTLDVTATIVDLAVRGHLHIAEVPKEGWFGKTDWVLTKREAADALLPYEQSLHDALFESGAEVTISGLKNKFADDLKGVKTRLYRDALDRRWFARNPETVKLAGIVTGVAVIGLGVLTTIAAGLGLERALLGFPVALLGLLIVLLAPAMPRRTAAGSEALRRVLGFRLYVATAEKRQHEFNEQQNIFARYLPYAIVFGCVEKWARAFAGLEGAAQASTAGWYSGTGPFQVMAFSTGLRGFAGSVSSTLASTPGGSGGSGFSGGFSGGGGGGGGGGRW